MVREVGVHDDHKITGCIVQAMHVGGAETEFARPGFQDDVGRRVGFLELLGDSKGTVWRGVVDDYNFIV